MAPAVFAFPTASYFIFARFHAAYFGAARWFYWPGWLTACPQPSCSCPAAIYVVTDLAESPKLDWTWPKG